MSKASPVWDAEGENSSHPATPNDPTPRARNQQRVVRRSSLLLPATATRAQIRTQGAALDVLTEVLRWPELPT
ncbi:MAG: hypothetical protein LC808_29465 [Actinobacteria bacterium]|nr:hypothetical protein [Actinomycetota bacterium]